MNTPLPETTAAELIARARTMAADLRARADEAETARRLPQDVAARMAEAGFYRMLVARAFGGLEVTPQTFMDVLHELGQADGAPAWCIMVGATTGLTCAYLQHDAAEEVFAADPKVITAGVFAPMGRAETGTGDAVVSGRWAWGSGSHNAHWVFGGARLMEKGAPLLGEAGRPRMAMFAMPASKLILHDNWDPMGLAGTGSSDFEAQEVRVPLSHAADITGKARLDTPLYAFPLFGILAIGIASVCTGLARQAIDELVAIASGKVPQGGRRTLAERPVIQAEVAQAEAELRAARAFLADAAGTAWDAARAEGEITAAHRRDLRLAASHAVQASAGAVGRMYTAAGGSSVHRASPLQRAFRDVHVATQHMMVAPATWELAGRLFLGLETDVTTL